MKAWTMRLDDEDDERAPGSTGVTADGITFASALDAARYRALVTQERRLQAQLVATQGELAEILRRARWSLNAILDQEG